MDDPTASLGSCAPARVFVAPSAAELAERGVPAAPSDDSSQASGLDPSLVTPEWAELVMSKRSVRARWRALGRLDAPALLESLDGPLRERSASWRALLILALARDEGYDARFERGQLGPARPLFDLLDPARWAELRPANEHVLWAIADSSLPERQSLHPMAALAALALWLHSATYGERALTQLLSRRHLPEDPAWLAQIVRGLHAHAPDAPLALARAQLSARFWSVAARLSALDLLARRWRATTDWPTGQLLQQRLIQVCDRVSQERPHEAAQHLQLMADAALGGQLDHPWLERVVEASVRLSIDDVERQARLRAFHAARHYEADLARLSQLYSGHIKMYRRWLAGQASPPASLDLERSALALGQVNPTRAQRLLELALVERARAQARGAWRPRRLDWARRAVLLRCDRLDPIACSLIELIVKNMDVSPAAADLVRRLHAQLDWSVPRLITRQELELYLVISDYDRAFKHLTCKYDGVNLHHQDKHAAERLKYFIQKRAQRGAIGLTPIASAPLRWVGQSVASARVIQRLVEQIPWAKPPRARGQDLSSQVLANLRAAGVSVTSFEQIAALGLDQLHLAMQHRRRQRIVLGALAGGLSGGLAPLSWGLASLADIPVTLGLAAELCERFCWDFGFDPREHPELPMTILAVALGGADPQAIEPMLLRHSFQEFVVRRRLVATSLSYGGLWRVATRAMDRALTAAGQPALTPRALGLASQAVGANLQRRAAGIKRRRPGLGAPLFGALMGAALGGALIYDLCEAAQAVLTDRFLERKYPEWASRLSLEGAALQDADAPEVNPT